MKSAFVELLRERVLNGSAWLLGFEVSRHGLGAHIRIVDLPVAEETILGLAVGLQRAGAEVFVDLMFETFAWRCLDVLINQAAVTRLMTASPAGSVVVRALAGPFDGAGPQHGGVGTAVLARLPHVEVAVPVHGDDVRAAHAAFRATGVPAFMLMPAASSVGPEARAEGVGSGRLRVVGTGSSLGIACLGPHLHLVLEAVRRVDMEEMTTVVAPLFLAPLPAEGVALRLAHCERVVIVDIAPPPVGLAAQLASVLRGRPVEILLASPDPTVQRHDWPQRVALLSDSIVATVGRSLEMDSWR